MARTTTLALLRTAVRTRGSWEGSSDITDTILNDFINEAIAEVWDLLISTWADYYSTEAALVTTPGSDTVALPATFYKLRKLEVLDSGTTYRRLNPHDLAVSHLYRSPVTRKQYRYRIQGGSLRLVPTPAVAETLRLTFLPWSTVLVADSDTFDGINGYEKLVLQLVMLRCLARQELDTSGTEREIARLSAKVRTAADGRDAAEPFYLNPHGPPDDDGDYEDQWD